MVVGPGRSRGGGLEDGAGGQGGSEGLHFPFRCLCSQGLPPATTTTADITGSSHSSRGVFPVSWPEKHKALLPQLCDPCSYTVTPEGDVPTA